MMKLAKGRHSRFRGNDGLEAEACFMAPPLPMADGLNIYP